MQAAAMALIPLLMAACPPARAGSQPPEKQQDGASGTLYYGGDYGGKIVFKSADCGVLDGELVTFDAPHEENGIPASGGSSIGISFAASGVPGQVVFALDTGAVQDEFMQAAPNKNNPADNIKVVRSGRQWQIRFQGLKLYDTNFAAGADTLQQLASARQKSVVLRGTLRCTRMP